MKIPTVFPWKTFFLKKDFLGKMMTHFLVEKTKPQKRFIDKNVDYFPQESLKKEILGEI